MTPSIPMARVSARIVLVAVAALISVTAFGAAAQAETQRVERAPDHNFSFDAALDEYGVVAVGDVNGDGHQDAIFQAIERPVRDSSPRRLEVLLGPFDLEGGQVVYPATIININAGAELAAVAVADINGDGLDDISYAHASRRGLDPVERQRVAVLFGRQVWDSYYYIGEASRGDRKLERKVELPEGAQTLRASKLSLSWHDLNADGHLDLVLAADPPEEAATSTPQRNGAVAQTSLSGGSRIVVMYGDSEWLFQQEAETGDDAWYDRGPIRDDVLISGMGACTDSLVGVAEATGDDRLDLVVRRCPGEGLPDTLGLVAGGAWPASLPIEDAIPDRPPVTPGEPPSKPAPPRSGYLPPSSPGGTGDNPFEPGATAFVTDLDGDGIADVGMDFTDKTHIWRGGPDLGDRLLAMHSSRAFVRAGYGMAQANHSWRPADLDGDGTRDLLVTLRPPVPLVPEEEVQRSDDPRGPRPVVETPSAQPLHIFRDGRVDDTVLDITREPADAVWTDEQQALWAMGDFNGDGLADLLLGSPPGSGEASFGVVFGPVVR